MMPNPPYLGNYIEKSHLMLDALCLTRPPEGDTFSYCGMPEYAHETVSHGVGKYVQCMVSTNGIESFWAMLKRGHQSVYRKISPKHLDWYVQKFAGRHNTRDTDTIGQMAVVVACVTGKRLHYRELISDNGQENGTRG